jgi:tetratricopeptide (TPR) repeat protein
MPSVQPPPGAAHDSAGKLKRAEMLSERRNFDEAKRIVDEVIASDAKSAEALALRAWLLYQTSSSEPPTQDLLQAIEGALRLNVAQPQALYVKGLVMRRIGREPAALRHFKLALDADPRHVEAARELRLAKMRRDR